MSLGEKARADVQKQKKKKTKVEASLEVDIKILCRRCSKLKYNNGKASKNNN